MRFYSSDPRVVQNFRDRTVERDKSPLNKAMSCNRRCHGCGLGKSQEGGIVRDGKFYCAKCRPAFFPNEKAPLRGQEYMDYCLGLIEKLEARRDDLVGNQKGALTRIGKAARAKFAEGDWRDLIETAEKLMSLVAAGKQKFGASAPATE